MPESATTDNAQTSEENPLGHAIYVSKVVTAMDDLQLAQLLAHCRKRNAEHGITGMLLYKSGAFMQVIEGDTAVVNQLMTIIRADSRHKNVEILAEGSIASRSFPDWTMAFTNIDRLNLSKFDGFSDFLNVEFDPDYFKVHNVAAHDLLLAFKREVWEV